MKVSIITPTYNRAYILPRLYESLKNQTSKDFEWIIINDGSTDETERLIKSWEKSGELLIQYFSKLNGGKHTGINLGVKNAAGEIIFIVDSDDYLISTAVEKIIENFKDIENDKQFGGICFKKFDITQNKVLGKTYSKVIVADLIEAKYKYRLKEDRAECFKKELLLQFPFPIFKNEKFVPESLVLNRIAKFEYKFKFYNEAIYFCEYLADGYTKNIKNLKKKNKKAYYQYYLEEFQNKKIPIFRKVICIFHIINLLNIFISEKIKIRVNYLINLFFNNNLERNKRYK